MPDTIGYKKYTEEDWQWLFLAARATVEQQKPLRRYTEEPYLKLRKNLIKHLGHLVRINKEQSINIREEAASLLGKLGDPRSGVTVIKDREGKPKLFNSSPLPDIKWEPIPSGILMMGFTDKQAKESLAKTSTPQHKVEIQAFKISRYPVTNAQYQCFIDANGYHNEDYWRDTKEGLEWLKGKQDDLSLIADASKEIKKIYKNHLAGDTNRIQPSYWDDRKWNNPNHPVVGICWYEALAFCRWLQTTEIYANSKIRLPTEAEWEYAARGDKNLSYAWGKKPDAEQGNYADTNLDKTSAVGLFSKGKAFDTYDMSGNVWEWTSSQWGKHFNEPDFTYKKWEKQSGVRDKLDENSLRIIRGGSFDFNTDFVRCAFRYRNFPYFRYNDIGFRVVRM